MRIARSALDDNVPDADLYVTASHALLIDGVLVPAGDLAIGTTIALDDAASLDRLDYFHIELDRHDVLDAEGLPCESLLGRGAIGVTSRDPAVDRPQPQARCLPMLSFDGHRNEVKSRLRSALSIVADRR